MTDNTQKLDEILKEVREASWSMGLQGAPLDQLHNPRNNKRATDKAKQAILNWHNKHMEAELEALREEVKHEDLRTISQIITARIDKLKEAELKEMK